MAKLARYRTGLPNPESDLPGVSLTGAKAGDWEKKGSGLRCLKRSTHEELL